MSPGKQQNVIYSSQYDKNLKPFLLFAHAFAGCDTTSAIFKKGKKSIISLLKKNTDLQQLISVFYEPNRSIDELYNVAETIILHLYGENKQQQLTISELRYKIFTSTATAFKKEVVLASLPPTESALREHTKRVYYQLQQWLGHCLNPEEWGWRKTLFMMIPIMSAVEPAPKELIEKVFCSCKTNCTSARCSCKKSGLKCNRFCRNCQGQTCENASTTTFVLEEDEDEDREEDDNDNDDEHDDNSNTGSEELGEDGGNVQAESLDVESSSKNLTKKIFCSCKSNCASARCSCKRSSLKCNTFCKNCHGQSCDNSSGRFVNQDDVDKDQEEEEEEEEELDKEEESQPVTDTSSCDNMEIDFANF